MNLKTKVEQLLEREPLARERRNKARAVAHILMEMYHIDPEKPEKISKDRLMNIVNDANSLDRLWRKVTEERPDLRGKDYDTKQIVEQRAQQNLGYESGYYEHIKQLKTV
jgi:hypothetical protein